MTNNAIPITDHDAARRSAHSQRIYSLYRRNPLIVSEYTLMVEILKDNGRPEERAEEKPSVEKLLA